MSWPGCRERSAAGQGLGEEQLVVAFQEGGAGECQCRRLREKAAANEEDKWYLRNWGGRTAKRTSLQKRCEPCQAKAKFGKKFDHLGLSYSQHLYFGRVQEIISSSALQRMSRLRSCNPLLRGRHAKLTSIDDRQMARHPGNLFYSDEVLVQLDTRDKPAILVIYQGFAYFISKDPENLRRGSRTRLSRALLVPPFSILDDVDTVLLPTETLENSK